MSLEDIRENLQDFKRKYKVIRVFQINFDEIDRLIAFAEAAKEFMHLERPRCRMFPDEVIMDARIKAQKALDALDYST